MFFLSKWDSGFLVKLSRRSSHNNINSQQYIILSLKGTLFNDVNKRLTSICQQKSWFSFRFWRYSSCCIRPWFWISHFFTIFSFDCEIFFGLFSFWKKNFATKWKIIKEEPKWKEIARYEFVTTLHKKNHLNTKKNVTLKPKFVKTILFPFPQYIQYNFSVFANRQNQPTRNLCPNKLNKK